MAKWRGKYRNDKVGLTIQRGENGEHNIDGNCGKSHRAANVQMKLKL